MKQSSGLIKMLIQLTYEYVCNIHVSFEYQWLSPNHGLFESLDSPFIGEKGRKWWFVWGNQGPLTKTSRAELGVQPGSESRTLAPPKWRTASEIWVKAALIT